ncbi:hypothetical protein O181_093598 [Austropuccinia psidii MF-1]|uniref:Uncharacterized protein n=1 Tax=Austropuccinia psidii MF-1 TaxID=1389203 RepID=A0A9Q3J0J9_9BASI|nr:hypothetical protein [Austropuccinia psidii MF-1]
MTSEQANTSIPEASPPKYIRDVGLIIDQGISMIKQEYVLCVDGSNFPTWERRLRLIFDNYLQDPMYLQQGKLGDDRTKCICCAILLSSLPDCIQDSVITLRPCSTT